MAAPPEPGCSPQQMLRMLRPVELSGVTVGVAALLTLTPLLPVVYLGGVQVHLHPR